MTTPPTADRISPAEAERLRRRATIASVAVAFTLITAKLVAYLMTGAVSILSSLVDSCTDLMASLVTLYGVRHAMKPADPAHRYGHGKAEPLAALAQAAFVTGSAVFLGVEAVHRFTSPQPVEDGAVGVGVMVLSIALTAVLIAYQRHVVTRTGSIAIGADRLHYSGDLLMNSAVIAALVLTTWTGIPAVDPLFALGIAAFLVYGAHGIARDALNVLMDHELPEAARQRITAAVLEHRAVRGMHDLRTRSTGTGVFIELHLELDPALPLTRAHDITDAVERDLKTRFDPAEVLIHQEPAGLRDDRLDERVQGG
ncbi:ferrous-iron efflux pump FieF [Azospirillum fermentarium]|uniref:cation diffusion facilitator family transporter n=1 Tax=Azospirillum fermentarium TaxID=1233114 RepID=UPI0022265148|nr:cation diffusion facilitator family transporter [Azospirillum fermentarium]MCW2247145.1 ferrous-iron efflux pump FieF [Azospirillum fermentarium]